MSVFCMIIEWGLDAQILVCMQFNECGLGVPKVHVNLTVIILTQYTVFFFFKYFTKDLTLVKEFTRIVQSICSPHPGEKMMYSP